MNCFLLKTVVIVPAACDDSENNEHVLPAEEGALNSAETVVEEG
jgi:hypothetical protein